MRVTQNLFADSMIGRLNSLTARQYGLQSQVSSGLRVQAPSDDPNAMQNVLAYQTSQAAQTQYGSNIATLQDRANSIYNVLQSLQTISNRVGEISTLAGDPTKGQPDRDTYAAEVSQLVQKAAQLVNTKDTSTGQYLFGGTTTGQPPFAVTKDASGNITGVAYQGNASVDQVEIESGATLSVDVPGENNSGSGARGLVTDSRSGADLFSHLLSLQNNLLAGNVSAITGNDVPALRQDENHILFQISNNGVMQSRLNSASAFASDTAASLDKLISKASDADIVQTMVQLNATQNAYQAALQSGAKIMQLSLLNYLQ